jgi:hypothetical protein
MNRRGFLTSLGALASTSLIPNLPSIRVIDHEALIRKLALNYAYGNFLGGRAIYCDTDGVIELV